MFGSFTELFKYLYIMHRLIFDTEMTLS